jgi:hypothetical protein
MEHQIHDGVPYEIEVVSLAHGDDVALELTDMSPDGGLLAEVRVSAGLISSIHQQPMPVEVFQWWTAVVVATGLAHTETDEP